MKPIIPRFAAVLAAISSTSHRPRSGGHAPPRRTGKAPGFTVTELLVTIAIVVVLAAIAFSGFSNFQKRADEASCLSRLHQVSSVLVASAADGNNQIRLFQGGSGGFDYRPYFVVSNQLNVSQESNEAYAETMRKTMFCPTVKSTPKNPHWSCYGVNFTPSERAGVEWVTEKFEDWRGRTSNLNVLHMGSVDAPSDYVFVADSCNASGDEIFRISGKDLVGLRHQGRANAAFLDGSARSLSPEDLGKLGFERAYDASTTPPQSVSLPRSNW